MDDEEKQFENFLRQFEPQKPRALPGETSDWRRFASAAAVLVALTGGVSVPFFWEQASHPIATESAGQPKAFTQSAESGRNYPLIRLTKIALEAPERLDQALAKATEDSFPRMDRRDSTLRALAKE